MKGLIFLYMCGGLAVSSVIEPYLNNKNPASSGVQAGIGVAALVLIAWNVWMYRQAARPGEADAGKPAGERYLRPVSATISFVLGVVALLIA